MQEVSVKHPSRFRATGRVVVTKDGRPFYTFDNPKQYTFTLPAGTYSLTGGTLLGRMPSRRGHRVKSAVRFQLPKTVRIIWATNPRKAVISLPDGVIVCDPSLKALPEFCLMFVLFHEIGHYFYQEERECDRFAAEEMHRRGYNPSQILIATELTLGDPDRRSCNLDNAKRLNR